MWNDDKGYGFISPLNDDGRVFVHINQFSGQARRPKHGDVVTYTSGVDSRGRSRAERVSIAGLPDRARLDRPSGSSAETLGILFVLLVCAAGSITLIPLVVPAIYVVASAATYVAYALDKSAASKGRWRTSESTLHLLALTGGWPGALIAQHRLRHKTRKQPFRVVFWTTVLLNFVVFAWWLTPEGQRFLRAILPPLS